MGENYVMVHIPKLCPATLILAQVRALPLISQVFCSDLWSVESKTSLLENAVDCAWGSWNEWGQCTKTCGRGTQQRIRSVIQQAVFGGVPCAETASETNECNTQPCPGKDLTDLCFLDTG